ncbi:MAG: cyclodeaminase/cyclohydrolase family protein [Planctomycetes bacterium]|nr:cyclodeaminase/cyclohydrolase family protein [Planctomycetota bacterium]
MYDDGTLKRWLDDLAARVPVPGGGSAAALAGAAGCACLAMAARFTVDKEGFRAAEAEFRGILDRVEAARAELGRLVDEDVASYAPLAAAYALPKGTEAEKAARKAAVQQALKGAVDPPRRVCRLAREALALAPALLARGNPNLASDVGVGAQCLACAFRSAWLNVEVNLASLKDAAFKAAVRAELDPLAAEVEGGGGVGGLGV